MKNFKQTSRLAVLSSLLLGAFALSGCSTGDRPMTDAEDIKTRCLDGVTYYLYRETAGYSGYGYMSVKFNRDGSVNTCGT